MCGLAKVAARMEDERLMRRPEDLLRPDRAVTGGRPAREFELRRSVKRPSGDVLSI
jgi:hypothetical protein